MSVYFSYGHGILTYFYDSNTRWQIMASSRSGQWLYNLNLCGLRLWKWDRVNDRSLATITIPERPLWSWHLESSRQGRRWAEHRRLSVWTWLELSAELMYEDDWKIVRLTNGSLAPNIRFLGDRIARIPQLTESKPTLKCLARMFWSFPVDVNNMGKYYLGWIDSVLREIYPLPTLLTYILYLKHYS